MASNYETICEENRGRYGTEGAQKSGGLAAGLYDNRTHFIFELLQNAEDALGRRGDWKGPRKITFALAPTSLALSHFGKPFDQADVRSVCDIAESTKNELSIGRFGLGFKSVYTVTDLPEIHSGDEDFAIEDYVFPKAIGRTARAIDETQIVLPLKEGDRTALQEITAGFRNLGPGALLFLRHIDEINWSVEGGATGFYIRNSPESLGSNVQRITVIGQESGQPEVDQNWLVFHRDVFSVGQQKVGRVEIAFSLVAVENVSDRWVVQSLSSSPLVVFFPTVVETHLGFLVQGPYRTTPSRDNIPPNEPWNQHLVKETASLLVEAMQWMRDKTILDVSALSCLPLDRKKFPQNSRFVPLFDAVRHAFLSDRLLPRSDGDYITARHAKLARTKELRELFGPGQMTALFGSEGISWLSGDITQDKAPEIQQYLTNELDIALMTPAKLVPNLTKSFLEAQPDEWVLRLYEFLNGQEAAVRRHLDTIPLVRLANGTHVVARENGEAKAFLPSALETSFPTVRRAVCASPEACAFLGSLRITGPDPVDDVIRNILPKYRQNEVELSNDVYAADIERIRSAFSTDSATQREKLRSALRETAFVRVVDSGNGKGSMAKPGDIYIATDRLKQLFAGITGVFIVDDAYDCLRGEDTRELLVACGASRYLSPRPVVSTLGADEKAKIRKEAGLERASRENQPEDFTIHGLAQLLEILPKLDVDDAKVRAELLWDALADLEARGTGAFYGSYKWSFFHETKTARFDAAFIQTLNLVAWVPCANGALQPPGLVVFDTLGWKPNPFLLTKLAFKPPIIDQLAKAAGIDPAALDLLRKCGITNITELAARLGIPAKEESNVYSNAQDLYDPDMPEIKPGTYDPDSSDGATGGAGGGGNKHFGTREQPGETTSGGAYGGSGSNRNHTGRGVGNGDGGQGKRPPGHAGGRPFISYIGAHPNDVEPDPDGLEQAARMQIEEQAIRLITSLEPQLRRTANGNPGFDLYEIDHGGKPIRWVEVKSMTGSLDERPVGLSHKQFECAREHSAAYWLYVVEYASAPGKARVLRIQNPIAHARTFTFDKGWAKIAHMKPPAE
ncbi:sacsin N-terminal ATP-binding-like domain-containing protein [Noviherbaspirillum suwonense]|uniref:Protein NO VEIN C-terminal domain-containing protein n=1 Tax=Noviherbaspirillum suwonense TaxID=1224511 RepID=A0ABY1QSR6_9BURK|nr:DUF3883 domain-containing protein [Noviherbaspirillum suwonense]SMP79647.1 protein of unknown function [Noviherbaspirillum suwonense]